MISYGEKMQYNANVKVVVFYLCTQVGQFPYRLVTG